MARRYGTIERIIIQREPFCDVQVSCKRMSAQCAENRRDFEYLPLKHHRHWSRQHISSLLFEEGVTIGCAEQFITLHSWRASLWLHFAISLIGWRASAAHYLLLSHAPIENMLFPAVQCRPFNARASNRKLHPN